VEVEVEVEVEAEGVGVASTQRYRPVATWRIRTGSDQRTKPESIRVRYSKMNTDLGDRLSGLEMLGWERVAKDVRWIENLEGSREGEEEARVTFEEAVAESAGGASVSESEPDESSAGEWEGVRKEPTDELRDMKLLRKEAVEERAIEERLFR